MLTWIILWVILFFLTVILVAMELVNGSLEWRFFLIIGLCFALILTPIFVIGTYQKSVKFVNEYEMIENYVANCETKVDEYSILDTVIKYNSYLALYQNKYKTCRFIIPYTTKLWKLKPIELKYFETKGITYWDY